MRDQLIEVMARAGKPLATFESPDGVIALVSPYGGRILGLYTPQGDENFFWTHDALRDPQAARAFFASDQWQNLGGDRTWLAPEIDFFFPRFPDLKVYAQPRQLDPGNYKLMKDQQGIGMSCELTVIPSRLQKELRLKLTKAVTQAPDPLRHERDDQRGPKIRYAGYTLKTTLEILSDGTQSRQAIGLWNLLQLPNGGRLIVPLHGRTAPKPYFGQVPAGDLTVTDRLIVYAMRAPGEQKLGLRAAALTGRAGYLYPFGDEWALVVRNFSVNPSGEYVDVPWEDTDDFGYALQACNINSSLGRFSELEYHVPAIGGGAGARRGEDLSQVWAYRGPLDVIQNVIRALLSPDFQLD
jgi:hypothetical protein